MDRLLSARLRELRDLAVRTATADVAPHAVESIGWRGGPTRGCACSSTAMCFGMHAVGTATIAAKASPYPHDRYLTAIAEGRHVTSLALSEPDAGSHLYLSETTLRRDGDAYVVEGRKSFVTNGGRADSYVVSTMASGPGARLGEFSCLVVDGDTAGLTWSGPWRGFGMRGHASRGGATRPRSRHGTPSSAGASTT